MTVALDCCVSDTDRRALTDLVSSLAYHPVRMAVDQRRAVVGPRNARRVCRGWHRVGIRCPGCDLAPVVTARATDGGGRP